MLARWSLGGFKSFGEKQHLNLSPITVFCGANSSGKSTILQSILLLKQTVQYGSSNRPIALNGPLVRLGTFDDVSHYDSTDRRISIDFTFNIGDLSKSYNHKAPWLGHLSRTYLRNDANISMTSGSFEWVPQSISGDDSPTGYDKLQGVLARGEIVIHRTPSGETQTAVDSFARFKALDLSYSQQEKNTLKWASVAFDPLSTAEMTQSKPDPSIGYLWLNFFLPGAVAIDFDEARDRARNLVDSLFQSHTLLTQSRLESEVLPPDAAEILNSYLIEKGEDGIEIGETGVPAIVVNQRLQKFRPRMSLGISLQPVRIPEDLQTLSTKIEEALVNFYPESRGTEFKIPHALDSASDFVIEYLKSGVRYLGPLRDEPKPVYPLEALENPTDVGYRGEHTAAVLYLNSNATIYYVAPGDLSPPHAGTSRQRSTLREAVGEWLKYLGVATDVVATDAGVFGNQLQVKTEGTPQFHDLTNVGVGVSQVLPIVVSALLAPETSLLIFEQPELHLHPRVQARLADFFYSIAIAGKQCILETHSEYMIDRLRRRIAEEDDDRLKEMLSIYFTERSGGSTYCRPVTVNRYGAINDWPKDFFEQSQMELKTIIEAASKKRIREKQRPQ